MEAVAKFLDVARLIFAGWALATWGIWWGLFVFAAPFAVALMIVGLIELAERR